MHELTSTLLRNGLIVTMNAGFEVFEGDLWIEDGRIARIARRSTPHGPLPAPARDDQSEAIPKHVEHARTIDCQGMVIMPGFVQTHIHLCQTLMRNCADDMVLIDWLRTRIWPYESQLDPESLYTSAKLGLAELLLGGTTTILDMGTVRHTDAIGEAVQDSGMRAWIGKCMMDNAEQVPPGLLESTSSSLAESHALFERWNGRLDGLIHYAFCPRFAISCTDALLRQVSEMATDLNALIHTHSSETSAENTYTNRHFGKSNVAYLDDVCMTGPHSVFAHGVHLLNGDTDILSRTSTAIAHCPSSNLKLASGIANLPELDAAGVRLSLGADGAPCNNSLDAFIEMRLAALLQKPFHGPTAMPARRTLTLATLDGARALGVDDQIGSLEVGKQADIVVLDLDGDPGTGPSGQDIYSRIVYSCHRHNVVHVFVRGVQRVDNSTLVEWDLAALIQNARQALKSITQKM